MFTNAEFSVLHDTKRRFMNSLKTELKNSEYDHYTSRIKTNKSIQNKLIRKGVENPTAQDAVIYLQDLIGVRIVTQYINDIYDIVDIIKANYKVIEEIDYITTPKSSGYRSYHIVIDFPIPEHDHNAFKYCKSIPIELQIRTMGMDFWASLEHSVIYDKTKNMQLKHSDNRVELVNKELLRYAEDIFSIDMRIQALQHITEHAMQHQKN